MRNEGIVSIHRKDARKKGFSRGELADAINSTANIRNDGWLEFWDPDYGKKGGDWRLLIRCVPLDENQPWVHEDGIHENGPPNPSQTLHVLPPRALDRFELLYDLELGIDRQRGNAIRAFASLLNADVEMDGYWDEAANDESQLLGLGPNPNEF